MAGLTDALVLNAVVLTVVFEADLGRHRKIGWFRIARPIVTAAAVVPAFVGAVATHGTGLLMEVAATVAGLLLGLAASSLMTVYRSPRTGRAVSRAGLGYAGLWVAVVGARVAFSYGSDHWFGRQLGDWMATHEVSASALTDSLIFMALAMLVTRTVGLGAHAANLPAVASPARRAAALVS